MRAAWLVALAVACTKTDTEECSSADCTDADTDADTDSDTDADTDTDVEPATVCDDGVAPFTAIQDAIDAAADGDRIVVCPGHYDRIEWAGKDLALIGQDAATTFIGGDADHPALTLQSATGELAGFTVKGDGAAEVVDASLYESTISLHDVRFSGVVSSPDADVVLVQITAGAVDMDDLELSDNFAVGRLLYVSRGTHTLAHSRIHDNEGGCGVFIHDGVTMDVSNNLFYGNDSHGSCYGLEVPAQNTHVRVANNTWYGNNWQSDAYVREGIDFDANLYVNARYTNGFMIQTLDGDYNMGWADDAVAGAMGVQVGGEGNVMADPLLVDPEGGDFHLGAGSPAIDAADLYAPQDVDGSRADVGAYGGPGGAW